VAVSQKKILGAELGHILRKGHRERFGEEGAEEEA
jgi:hypothetical protein